MKWYVALLVAAGALLAGCGGGTSSGSNGTNPATASTATAKSSPAPERTSEAQAAATATATATQPSRTAVPAITRTVVVGGSWYAIAAQYGVAADQLYSANGLSGPTRALRPGDTVRLPTANGVPLKPTATRTRPAPTATVRIVYPTPTPVMNLISYPGNGGRRNAKMGLGPIAPDGELVRITGGSLDRARFA